MNKKSCSSRHSSGGFSLIELAIVITIVSLLILPAIRAFENWQNQSRLTLNQQRLDAIQQSLANFMAQNGRLPCPASFTAKSTDARYGREIAPLCLTSGGKSYIPDGKAVFAATGRTTPKQVPPLNSAIIIGAVPVRDLGLPDSTRADAWGHLFTYAVSAAEAGFLGNGGVIDVVDEAGHSVLPYASDKTSTGTAAYVLIGHGKDGKGAYLANPGTAAAVPPVPCYSAPGLDTLNCSFEKSPASPFAFRSAPVGSRPGATWFDDTVVFYTHLSPVIPAPAPQQQSQVPVVGQQLDKQLSDQEQKLLQEQLKNLPQMMDQMNDLRKELQQTGQ